METARAILHRRLIALPALELWAAWLRTDPGLDWVLDNPEAESPVPVVIDDVIDLAFRLLCEQASNWSNRRIRDYVSD